MKRVFFAAGLVATVVPLTIGDAQAARTGVVPVTRTASCKATDPVVVDPGQAPRLQLRVVLTSIADHSASVRETESVQSRTRTAGGKWTSNHGTSQVSVAYKAGRVTNGTLPVAMSVQVPHASATEAKELRRVHLVGQFDALGGGSFDLALSGRGTPAEDAALRASFKDSIGKANDHLPSEPIGVGGTWRLVNCDPVDGTPARETRTYTLQSSKHGVIVATYHDDVELDPAHVDLGTTSAPNGLVHYRLVKLHGTTTGTSRLPIADALHKERSQTTRLQVVIRATRPDRSSVLIESNIIDRDTTTPTS